MFETRRRTVTSNSPLEPIQEETRAVSKGNQKLRDHMLQSQRQLKDAQKSNNLIQPEPEIVILEPKRKPNKQCEVLDH